MAPQDTTGNWNPKARKLGSMRTVLGISRTMRIRATSPRRTLGPRPAYTSWSVTTASAAGSADTGAGAMTGGRNRGRTGCAENHCMPSPGAGRAWDWQVPSKSRTSAGPCADSSRRSASSGTGQLYCLVPSVLPLPSFTAGTGTSGVMFRMASCALTPKLRSTTPMAPRVGPLWPVMVQTIFPVPGMDRASMKVPGDSTRLPKYPASVVPSGLTVHRLWIGIAGRSTYSHREKMIRPSSRTYGVKSFR